MGVATGQAKDLPEGAADRIQHVSRRVYKTLELSGYARIDLRLDEHGHVYVLEANPNPQIARTEDFAASAAVAGLPYPALIQRILTTGLHGSRNRRDDEVVGVDLAVAVALAWPPSRLPRPSPDPVPWSSSCYVGGLLETPPADVALIDLVGTAGTNHRLSEHVDH
jgi:hypothetical protein